MRGAGDIVMGPLASAVGRLYGRRGWILLGLCALALFVLFPLSNLLLPKGSPFHISDYSVALAGKIICTALSMIVKGYV